MSLLDGIYAENLARQEEKKEQEIRNINSRYSPYLVEKTKEIMKYLSDPSISNHDTYLWLIQKLAQIQKHGV